MEAWGEARRELEAAAAAAERHVALLAAMEAPGGELAAALEALGQPGSPDLLEALAFGDHALLKAAVDSSSYAAVDLAFAYGDDPAACDAMVRGLEHDGRRYTVLARACARGDTDTVAALLAALQRAGCALNVLTMHGHGALMTACLPNNIGPGTAEVIPLLLPAYGERGTPLLLEALAMGGNFALSRACAMGDARLLSWVLAGYGHRGGSAVRAAITQDELRNASLRIVISGIHRSYECDAQRLAGFEACLAQLLDALADDATALRVIGGLLSETEKGRASFNKAVQRLARIPTDSLLARLAVRTPAAWALNPDAARALLSAPVRASLALPALLALRHLPRGVAQPVGAYLRKRQWLLFVPSAAPAPGGG
jgi:hypothetical protein